MAESFQAISLSKTLLAKLFAKENIVVMHDHVRTASFTPATRVMRLPYWDNITFDMYDLLVSHEAAHARFTPTDGFHEVCDKYTGAMRRYVNVVEDARIEKMQLRAFPGLKTPYKNGYATILHRGFFGIKNREEIKSYKLIDRINLFFKLEKWDLLKVPFFSKEEEAFVTRIARAESFEEVVQLSQEILAYDRAQHKKQKEESENGSAEGKGAAKAPVAAENDKKEEEKKEDEKKKKASGGHENNDEDEDDDFDGGKTDTNYRTSIDSLAAAAQEFDEVLHVNLPKEDARKHMIESRELLDEFRKIVHQHDDHEVTTKKIYKLFVDRNTNAINHLVKEFEMRKAADEHKRTIAAKTGDIEMQKVYSYKYNEDIFRKADLVLEGKSHAIMMVVDMSGSMRDIMFNTIDQMLILAEFCRRVKVPFEVYGFVDNFAAPAFVSQKNYGNSYFYTRHAEKQYTLKECDIDCDRMAMIQLITSTLNVVEHRDLSAYLLSWAHFISNPRMNRVGRRDSRRRTYKHESAEAKKERLEKMNIYSYGRVSVDKLELLQLSGTPLIEAMFLSTQLVRELKARTHAQIVHYIILTDGDGGSLRDYKDANDMKNGQRIWTETAPWNSMRQLRIRSKVIFNDVSEKSIYEYNISDVQREKFSEYGEYILSMNLMTQRLKKLGCNVININLITDFNASPDFVRHCRAFERSIFADDFMKNFQTAGTEKFLNTDIGILSKKSQIFTHEIFMNSKPEFNEALINLKEFKSETDLLDSYSESQRKAKAARILAIEVSKLIAA